MKKYFLPFLIFAICFIAFSMDVSAQCSMCRAVVENNADNIGKGINNGILYLMGFPYLLIVVMGVFLFRKVYTDNKKYAHS